MDVFSIIQQLDHKTNQYMSKQGLVYLCRALKSVGDLWMKNTEWMGNIKYDAHGNLEQLGMSILSPGSGCNSQFSSLTLLFS